MPLGGSSIIRQSYRLQLLFLLISQVVIQYTFPQHHRSSFQHMRRNKKPICYGLTKFIGIIRDIQLIPTL